ncbi:ABC transporter substrate-binding protein [Ammoniphilus sp. 3BR4]|uniref:ABC transporter substrate-binding protein n=1 Tax=Ammoniphilus sp. 3BR4 TaxID=3158265 RepID=UPI003466FC82
MKKYQFMSLLGVALSVLLVTGCGSKDTAGPSEKGALDKIQSEKVMNVGIEGAFPPFNYFNDKNQLEGFDVDITNEMASRMGVKANFIATPWDSILDGLLSKKYDIIISSMTITDERKEKVDFTEPYYRTGAQLFVPDNSTIQDPTKLQGVKIGVSIGTTFEQKADELGAEMVTYKSDLLTFEDMKNGRVEGVITDKVVGAAIIKEKGYPFQTVGDLLYSEEVGIALNKNEEAFLEEINKHLKDMMEDGTYEKISQKWFNRDIR